MGIILWEMMMRVLKGEYNSPYGEYDQIGFDFQVQLALHPII
jgi:hypothetical protein